MMHLTFLTKIISTRATFSNLALRITLAIIFIGHGAQKLFGWFGGYGLEKTGQWMASIGFEPGFIMALLVGACEFFAGLALLVGILVRPAAAITSAVMIVATSIHINNGFFLATKGFEYDLLLLSASLTLLFQGAGKYSIDQYLHAKLIPAQR